MPPWAAAKSILCVRLDSIGDVLMTTPAIRALKNDTMASITLLTSHSGATVAPLVPEIDDHLVYPAPWMKATETRNPSDGLQMISLLKDRNFDAAVIFTVYSQNPLPAAFLCFLAGIPLRLAHCRENPYQLLSDWVPDLEPGAGVRHEVRRHLDLVATAGFTTSNERLSLSIPQEARDRVAALLREGEASHSGPLIVLHPGATASSRRYAPEKFAEVGRCLYRDIGAKLILTGSSDEIPLVEKIAKQMNIPCTILAGKLNVADLGALIERASVLVVNNTGPAHMAAALGTPVVNLYALTNPQHTPWQVASRVLFHDVPCKYCYKSVCPEGHRHCLELVSPQSVVDAVIELLAEKKESSYVHIGA